MLVTKKKIVNFLALGFVSMPLFAYAGDLVISNQTKFNSTSRINNNPFCSDQILGADGVTKAGEVKITSEKLIRRACIGHLEDCTAQVHMANGCQGPVISTVVFSVTRGVLSITPPILGYKVQLLSPFYVLISGGP